MKNNRSGPPIKTTKSAVNSIDRPLIYINRDLDWNKFSGDAKTA